MYLLIGLPPSHPGSNATDAEAFPAVAVPMTGGAGAVGSTVTVSVVETVGGESSLSVALQVTVVGPSPNIEPEA